MKHLTVRPTNMDQQTQDPRDALEVLADSADLYERKNADYGDSWVDRKSVV